MKNNQAKSKRGGKRPGAGRKPGVPNKLTADLKDAILAAAAAAGGDKGMQGYLQARAMDCPNAFLALLGKIIPTQIGGDPDNPVSHKHDVRFIIVPGQPRT